MTEDPEATYDRLVARCDLLDLDDDQALKRIGELVDLSEAEGWDRRVVMGPRRPGCR
jgi:hypothetical protein